MYDHGEMQKAQAAMNTDEMSTQNSQGKTEIQHKVSSLTHGKNSPRYATW